MLKRLPGLAAETRARLSDTRELMKTRKAQRLQGLKESAQAIALLQNKWPHAFSKKYGAVKPLARSVKEAVVAGMDWDPYYTSGVLAAWKSRWLIAMRYYETLSASILTAMQRMKL